MTPTDGPFDLRTIGAGLPFAGSLPALEEALTRATPGVAVVQAPPGTGKTTLVPPLLANRLARRGGGVAGAPQRVVVTAPRRVAARAAASRLAALAGETLGGSVGFTVRGAREVGRDTLVEMVTPGILLRRLLADPALPGVGAVVLDEVHERALDTDLLVGLLTEVRQLRDDLDLVAMSATVDAARFATLLGDDEPAALVDAPDALHPLTTRWAPFPGLRTDARGVSREFLQHVARTTAAAVADDERSGRSTDALVFVPGGHEVATVAHALRDLLPHREVLELQGSIAPALQDRATGGRCPGDPPRVVVSTALAESSLTVPGVHLVVDSGLSREPRRDAVRDMSGLVTLTSSRASADQRAGRAARLGPGTVVRCYDEATYHRMPAHSTPEILTADLTGAALTLACWGSPRGVGLRLPDAPPVAAMDDAEDQLRSLGAVGADGRVTEVGRRLAQIPVDPRLARGLLDGATLFGAETAAEVVALLAEDGTHPDLAQTLRERRRGGRRGSAGAWRHEADRLTRLARRHAPAHAGPPRPGPPTPGLPAPGLPAPELPTPDGSPETALGTIVALTWPNRLARVDGDTALLVSGTRAGLPAASGLRGHEWLAISEVTRAQGAATAGTGAVVRAAIPVDQHTVELAAAHLVADETTAFYDWERLSARRVRRIGAVVLSATPVRATTADARAAVRAALARDGLDRLTWPAGADLLRRRLALLHTTLGAPWPDVSDAALLADGAALLEPVVDDLARGRSPDLTGVLRGLLPWPAAARLDELAPERLTVPTGHAVRIEYPEVGRTDERPVVRVKLQECFGWAQTPTIADGRVRLLFHLLSPAGRPVAVTDDLASFWSGPYARVRAEMRGRYPRHPWPEDPWTAAPTARVKHPRAR